MKNIILKNESTEALVSEYNKLKAKASRMPRAIRKNAMPRVSNELQVILSEIQLRATQGDNQLAKLIH